MTDNIVESLTKMVRNVSSILPQQSPEQEERDRIEREEIRRRIEEESS